MVKKLFFLVFLMIFLTPLTGLANEKNIIVIETRTRLLYLFRENKLVKKYPVALGDLKTPTPIGCFKITFMRKNWGSGFGSRFLGLNVPWGMYGIHGTNKPGSIGSYASHGCIRMLNRHVEELYEKVHLQDQVIILGNPFTYQEIPWRTLVVGSKGSDVLILQELLKLKGYYSGPIDGIFGRKMEKAVVKFRADYGLPSDNRINMEMYKLLRIYD
ncbi:L,D-transpeptidase family protein [Carboxydothermus hydrogenoformans]|uniref:Putative peptidoglycan-binding protein n=1 Tax=Carboxydothermus hydrogenoformans (strain ATCC BAA-161 / DSM 6008 / Z-2901) TaxID=246194 RepID=Q3AFB0_CARHZ|nr:L,D-transpeptidase family protein [Carboxydothermus hydrogenoformans]ABB15180.1 putative peptidoglycan-binding protein [Carboxydothermus hydrogenoformans Z-2901]